MDGSKDGAHHYWAFILETARADNRVLNDPEPWVRVTNLGDSSVDLTARLWCRSDDYWELKFALQKQSSWHLTVVGFQFLIRTLLKSRRQADGYAATAI